MGVLRKHSVLLSSIYWIKDSMDVTEDDKQFQSH